ncbi:hypothetical protein K443DRAFT_679946 [Laccaria amethystina LaAM-08-1]|jgi:hypothetical protein|uniref:Uncharacterized protein n=1 Tax=Laccaria amethystina LaAM-08-1 TaxID=1095629 RepID=A0A0C9X2Z7_9AGAR|nr:hypothetical protein K443DRAFT_679946 [Laccaria amethystina LaAM-08-1]
MPGWEVVAAACRRFHYPGSQDDPFANEFLILPTSFVGLGAEPVLDKTEDFTCHDENVYCPSPELMLTTIIRTILRHPAAESVLSLMRVWMSYFELYAGFDEASLDGADDEVKELWKAEVKKMKDTRFGFSVVGDTSEDVS